MRQTPVYSMRRHHPAEFARVFNARRTVSGKLEATYTFQTADRAGEFHDICCELLDDNIRATRVGEKTVVLTFTVDDIDPVLIPPRKPHVKWGRDK